MAALLTVVDCDVESARPRRQESAIWRQAQVSQVAGRGIDGMELTVGIERAGKRAGKGEVCARVDKLLGVDATCPCSIVGTRADSLLVGQEPCLGVGVGGTVAGVYL